MCLALGAWCLCLGCLQYSTVRACELQAVSEKQCGMYLYQEQSPRTRIRLGLGLGSESGYCFVCVCVEREYVYYYYYYYFFGVGVKERVWLRVTVRSWSSCDVRCACVM